MIVIRQGPLEALHCVGPNYTAILSVSLEFPLSDCRFLDPRVAVSIYLAQYIQQRKHDVRYSLYGQPAFHPGVDYSDGLLHTVDML